jgi:hypothetical protein
LVGLFFLTNDSFCIKNQATSRGANASTNLPVRARWFRWNADVALSKATKRAPLPFCRGSFSGLMDRECDMRKKPTIGLVATDGRATPHEAIAAKLKELAERLDGPNSFAKGQIVAWKPGLKNRMFPEYGEPAIVTAVLPTPVFDLTETSSASPYFQEALTLVIGIFRDDDLLEFRVDARRFMPVTD